MFKNAIQLFEISGFKIRLDPSWFLIAALLVWGLSSSYFPEHLPGQTQATYIVIATVAMLGLFASVILHELAHSFMARRFGLNVGSITLFVFGGVAELEQEPRHPGSEFWIAIVGPIMSAILAGIAYALVANFGPMTGAGPLAAILEYLWQINLLLAVFNLVPAFPLDGGRVFRAALWSFKGDVVDATRIASRVGSGFGILLILSGIAGLIFQSGVGGFWSIIIGFFIVSASRNSYQALITKKALRDQTVSRLMTQAVTVVSPNDTIASVVNDTMLARNISFAPVVEKGELLGYVDLATINSIDDNKWDATTVGSIYKPVSQSNTIQTAMGVDDVLKLMSETGNRKLMIAKDGKLIGVVALADLLNYVNLRTNLAR